jgi:hypothetical protein
MTANRAILLVASAIVILTGCEPLFEKAAPAAQGRPEPAVSTTVPASVPPSARVEVSRGQDRKLTPRQVAAMTQARMSVTDAEIMRQLARTAERIAQNLPTGPAVPTPASVQPGSNRGLGYQLMIEFGWPASQWPALDALWQRESGWSQLAENRSSGAYGIPQSLPGSKMAAVGPDWRTNPETQIRWGLAYIGARYGSPEAAWAHSERFGWY